MANQNAKIDNNREKTLLGITDDSNAEIRRLLVDATTGRLKVSAVISSSLNSLNDVVIDGTPADNELLAYDTSSGNWINQTATEAGISTGLTTSGVIDINDYAKFSDSTILVGRSYSEVKTDLSLNNVENTAISTWAGSTNITTLGTIATGVWSGTVIIPAKGGTGVANGANNTITFSGNYTLGLTLSNNTSITLPTTGTLVNSAVTSLTSLGTVSTSLTGVLRADSGVLSADTDVTDIVSAASTTVAGKIEVATAAETTTGTDATRAVSPDGFADSDYGKRIIQIKVIDDTTTLTTGDGKIIFCIPVELNGYNLVDADAFVTTVSSSGLPTVQIRNVTDSQDMLSTSITIDANEFTSYTAATAPVINASYDDVATGDRIAIDVDVAGTEAKGLGVILSFQLP
jgi:hypothetical protein